MSLTLRIPPRLVVGDTVKLPCHRDPGRYTMPIPVRFLSDEGAAYLVYQELHEGWERQERDLLDACLTPDTIFVDVGAHWGIHALHAATAGATVLAVEPEPSNRRMLADWLAANGLADRVSIVPAALSDKAGQGHIRTNTTMGHAVVTDVPAPSAVYTSGPLRGQAVFIPCDILAFDDLAIPEGRPIVAKIDVEGHELAVLRGATRMLSSGRVRRVIWEMNGNFDAIRSFLAPFGYASTPINAVNALSTLAD